ncbi:MAG: InlB B-repeat-containing protein [Bacteroidales bacterium]|nr:InlB B-repeat-containing protein [Bacteroidales bacterium]
MKKNFILAVFCLIISAMTFAQVPQKMSYQAVVRGSDNNLVTNREISVRISILQGSIDGEAVYTETHSATTNANGLLTIEIGNGTSNDDFSAINWANGPYFVKTETDVNGGDDYDIIGVSQLLSVPYAMYAQTAGNVPDVSGFLTEETQTLADVVSVGNSANAQLKDVIDPTDNQDATTKRYVDELIAQLQAATDAINNIIPSVHTITFDSNGGTGVMQPQTFMHGIVQTINSNIFTKEEHWFSGWNTAADGSGFSYTNGQNIVISADITLYAQWRILTGTLNGHEWVDLGLPSGTKWAICNVGAENPEETGNYYAWGETTTKETYDWTTYSFCNGNYNTLTKYCSSSIYGDNGFWDSKTNLQSIDDAATVNWGEGWRMPTKEEYEELMNNCILEWTTINEVSGGQFTGPNGNTIFLPASGRIDENGLRGNNQGYYFSQSLNTYSPDCVWDLYIHPSASDFNADARRYMGRVLRPVCVLQ